MNSRVDMSFPKRRATERGGKTIPLWVQTSDQNGAENSAKLCCVAFLSACQ